MTVAEVKQSHGERYYIIFTDGSIVKTTLNTVLEYHIKSGDTLDTDRYSAFVSASTLARAKLRALRIVGARPMSSKELSDRLIEKGETPENAAECARWLVSLDYVNDEKYAGMIVRHYASKGYGRAKIKNELFRRGVPRELWEDAMLEFPEPDEIIDKLLRSKLKSENPDKKEIKRASDSLMRRGFSWSEIKSALSRYMSDFDEY